MSRGELFLTFVAVNLTLVAVALVAVGAVENSWWQPALGGVILTVAEVVRTIARDIACRIVCYDDGMEREDPT